jgi:hypothetical protein
MFTEFVEKMLRPPRSGHSCPFENGYVTRSIDEGIATYVTALLDMQEIEKTGDTTMTFSAETEYSLSTKKGLKEFSGQRVSLQQHVAEKICKTNNALVADMRTTYRKNRRDHALAMQRASKELYYAGYYYVRGACESSNAPISTTVNAIIESPPTTLTELNSGILRTFQK